MRSAPASPTTRRSTATCRRSINSTWASSRSPRKARSWSIQARAAARKTPGCWIHELQEGQAMTKQRAASAKPSDLVLMNGIELSRAIRSKQVSCVEVMNVYLDHIAQYNPRVNAIVALQPREGLLAQAKERDEELGRGEYRGWMHGFPHAVKDLTPVKGLPFTRGSPIFKDFVAPA